MKIIIEAVKILHFTSYLEFQILFVAIGSRRNIRIGFSSYLSRLLQYYYYVFNVSVIARIFRQGNITYFTTAKLILMECIFDYIIVLRILGPFVEEKFTFRLSYYISVFNMETYKII